jgi:hypothetical protein
MLLKNLSAAGSCDSFKSARELHGVMDRANILSELSGSPLPFSVLTLVALSVEHPHNERSSLA